jgi:cell division protease FtsH
VAEELVIKDITTGASADLQHVSDLARRMVTQWGMSEKLGLVAYDSDQPVFMGMEYGHQGRGGYSQETAATIDSEIRRLITEAHERATKLLQENRSILDNMSRVLVERETIYAEEVKMLMKGASYQEVIDIMENNAEERKTNPFAFAGGSAKEVKEEKVEEVEMPVETETSAEDSVENTQTKDEE